MTAPSDRPNLLLICTDNQRRDSLGCYGSRLGNTPHLDQLAAEGVVCDEAYTASPVCGPARCSLITGLHPLCHGAIENGMDRHADLATLPDTLAAAGYQCFMAGKTHFGPMPVGFEKVTQGPSVTEAGGYPARDSAVVSEALRWLEQRDPARPFFLFLSLHMPHEPFQPTNAARAKVDPRRLPPLDYQHGDLDQLPTYLTQDLGIPHESPADRERYFPAGQPDVAEIDRQRRDYYALAGMIDDQVGRVRRALDRLSVEANTLTVFTSDHGSSLFDRGFKDKHCFYDPVWRVPLIFHAPGRLRPRREAGLTGWIDLPPTLIGWANAEAPNWQGLNLANALQNRPARWPRQGLAASVFSTLALVTPEHKLIYDATRAGGQFFDRRNDPEERDDLWKNEHPLTREARIQTQLALLAWRAALPPAHDLLRRFTPGGPVARAAQDAVRQRPANHADRLLQTILKSDL